MNSVACMMDYRKHIVIDSAIRFGKPCVRGTRIAVCDVLGWLAAGMSKGDIVNDYPNLTEENILACLAYSADRERKASVIT